MNIWWAIAMMVISTLITASMIPAQQRPEPEALEDIDFPQVEEGTPQAVIFGDCWSGDWTVLAVGNYRTTPINKNSGGK